MPNTTNGSLVTQQLVDGATTILQNRLAPLRAFSKEVAADRVKPLAVLQHRKVTAGGTAQTNATNFEDVTNFVGTNVNVPITMQQITAGGHCTNAERQSGHALNQWLDRKIAEFSEAVMGKVAAVITTANFTADPLIVPAPISMGAMELRELWGKLKKASKKNIILDGEYFAQFLPSDLQAFDPRLPAGMPGWDGFFLNTYWTGATAGTVGFAGDPQAIVCGIGLPLRDSSAFNQSEETIIPLPDLGIKVALTGWYSNATRASWFTFDIMFGAAANDTTAGVLIKSA